MGRRAVHCACPNGSAPISLTICCPPGISGESTRYSVDSGNAYLSISYQVKSSYTNGMALENSTYDPYVTKIFKRTSPTLSWEDFSWRSGAVGTDVGVISRTVRWDNPDRVVSLPAMSGSCVGRLELMSAWSQRHLLTSGELLSRWSNIPPSTRITLCLLRWVLDDGGSGGVRTSQNFAQRRCQCIWHGDLFLHVASICWSFPSYFIALCIEIH